GAGGYAYSNGGFVLAGALLEAVTDEAWEVLMAERLFEPLGITTAGFGPPPNGHPRGHLDGESFDPADPMADNPQLAGPAGTVHMSAVDFAKIAAVHIRGPLAAKLNLPDDAWDVLHTPIEESYAAGLIVVEQPWTNGTAFTHSGSNTLWFATMWIVPGRDVAVVVCTNVMNDAAANDAILLALRELDRDW
ncbi:MAG: serine hydrolase domain-containing protein, partial [Planctomycetota bacterium]